MDMKSKMLFAPKMEEDDACDFGDDDDDDDYDYRETLERARKITQRKHGAASSSPPQSLITRLAGLFNSTKQENDEKLSKSEEEEEESKENKQIVFTDMEEFLHVHRLDPDDDVFIEDEEKEHVSVGPTQEPKHEEEEVSVPVPDENVLSTIHQEVAIRKGLSGAISLLKQRGELKEEENMDKKKKKSKLNDYGDEKKIVIIRRDENGKDLTPHEAFKVFSHRFHGKAPGKKKQEKRMKQEELKMKMKNNVVDTPSSSSSSLLGVERMREAQAQLKSPYLVLSGKVKPGQIRDHRSGYGLLYEQTAQAPDLNMNLTPTLGDRKVEFFLGKKRKPEQGGVECPPKKPKSEK